MGNEEILLKDETILPWGPDGGCVKPRLIAKAQLA